MLRFKPTEDDQPLMKRSSRSRVQRKKRCGKSTPLLIRRLQRSLKVKSAAISIPKRSREDLLHLLVVLIAIAPATFLAAIPPLFILEVFA